VSSPNQFIGEFSLNRQGLPLLAVRPSW